MLCTRHKCAIFLMSSLRPPQRPPQMIFAAVHLEPDPSLAIAQPPQPSQSPLRRPPPHPSAAPPAVPGPPCLLRHQAPRVRRPALPRRRLRTERYGAASGVSGAGPAAGLRAPARRLRARLPGLRTARWGRGGRWRGARARGGVRRLHDRPGLPQDGAPHHGPPPAPAPARHLRSTRALPRCSARRRQGGIAGVAGAGGDGADPPPARAGVRPAVCSVGQEPLARIRPARPAL